MLKNDVHFVSAIVLFASLALPGCDDAAPPPAVEPEPELAELESVDDPQTLLDEYARRIVASPDPLGLSIDSSVEATHSDRLPTDGDYVRTEIILAGATPCDLENLGLVSLVSLGDDAFEFDSGIVPSFPCDRLGGTAFFECAEGGEYPWVETFDLTPFGIDAVQTIEVYRTNVYDYYVAPPQTRLFAPVSFERQSCVGDDCGLIAPNGGNCASIGLSRLDRIE